MNILSLFYKDKKGGFNKRLYKLYEGLSDAGHCVHFIGSEKLPFHRKGLIEHITRLPFNKSENLVFWLLFIGTSFFKSLFIAVNNRINLILTFGPFYTMLCMFPIIILRMPALTFIRADNMKHSQNKVRNFFFLIIDYLGLRLSKRVVFVSNKLKESYKKRYSMNDANFFVLPNNIECKYELDSNKRNEIRNTWGAKPGEFLLSTSGVFSAGKNFTFLIRAMVHLQHDNIKLLIIGDEVTPTGEKKHLSTLVKDLQLEGFVKFCGWQNDPCHIVASSDLFVYPSLYEGSPNALLEALSCDVPCLGNDIEEIKEILLFNELLFSVNEESSFIDKVRKAKNDKEYYSYIVSLCNKRYCHFRFDWKEHIVNIVENIESKESFK